MEIEKVRPDTKADTLKSYYHALVAGLRKHLPVGEFESLAGEPQRGLVLILGQTIKSPSEPDSRI